MNKCFFFIRVFCNARFPTTMNLQHSEMFALRLSAPAWYDVELDDVILNISTNHIDDMMNDRDHSSH